MIERKRIIAFDKVQITIFVQNRKHKRTLDKFIYLADRLYVEGFLLLQKLNRNVAVCLDRRTRQRHLLA